MMSRSWFPFFASRIAASVVSSPLRFQPKKCQEWAEPLAGPIGTASMTPTSGAGRVAGRLAAQPARQVAMPIQARNSAFKQFFKADPGDLGLLAGRDRKFPVRRVREARVQQ